MVSVLQIRIKNMKTGSKVDVESNNRSHAELGGFQKAQDFPTTTPGLPLIAVALLAPNPWQHGKHLSLVTWFPPKKPPQKNCSRRTITPAPIESLPTDQSPTQTEVPWWHCRCISIVPCGPTPPDAWRWMAKQARPDRVPRGDADLVNHALGSLKSI